MNTYGKCPSYQLEVSCQLHAPAALPLEKEPLYPLDTRWADPSSGLDAVEKKKLLTLPGLGHPVRSQSVYRLFLSLSDIVELDLSLLNKEEASDAAKLMVSNIAIFSQQFNIKYVNIQPAALRTKRPFYFILNCLFKGRFLLLKK
jgi:hypothetical protein